MKIYENEIKEISSLEPNERYNYFIKNVANIETMYTLYKDGKFVLTCINNNKLLPLWSAKEFAENYRNIRWDDAIVQEISLDYFEDNLSEFEDFLFNIFPVTDKTGFVVTLDEFVRDLTEEFNRY